jgi:membrane-bound serine protease (ClpP class)
MFKLEARKILGTLMLGMGGLLGVSQLWAQSELSQNRFLVVVMRGTINPSTSDYLKEAIKRAEKEKFQGVLIELDTPGGLVTSVREMAQSIDESKVPVITYVSPAGASATSAGALLMLASHVSAMAPGTNIGAAHPVGSQGEDIKGASNEKATNDVSAFARSLAEVRGKNPELAQAVVEKSKSLTSQEAVKEKFIDMIATSKEELIQKIAGTKVNKVGQGDWTFKNDSPAVFVVSEMTMGQKLLNLLSHPNIAAILMSLGMLLIYVEVSNPGITIAGILGAISLVLAFMAFQVLPIRTGAAALMILALFMFIGELFVSTHGALGAGGAIAFCLGLLWLVDPSQTDLAISYSVLFPIIFVFLSIVTLLTYAAWTSRRNAARALAKIGGGQLSGLSGYEGHVDQVDDSGLFGKATVRGEVWDFVSDHPVQNGEQVKIDSVQGFKVKISKLKN